MPNWKKVLLNGSEGNLSTLSLTGLSAQNSETDVLTINGSNVVGTRQLGSNAFSSTTIPSTTNGVDNRIATFTGASAFNGEANLTFDGSNFKVVGDTQITGSLNISGSTTIEIPTGDAFTILEGDKDQQSRFIFDYTNGDPTFTVASRASTAKIHVRQDATNNGLYLDEDGQIYVNNSTSDGVKINGTCFASIGTNANALDLGSTSRPWNDVYLRSTGGVIIDGGTSAQFLKADGSVDSNTYSTATGVENNADVTDATNVAAAGALMASNNLSDLSSAGDARDNLGLGSVATTAASAYLAVSNNLSDVSNAATARTNLGSAKTGANSDITSLSGLTTALSVAQGGTGLTELGSANDFLVVNGAGNALEFSSSPTFRATDGTSTAPGISFSSDTNTGFYRSNNDELSIAIGGSQIGYFNSNGIQLNSGIGTSQIGGHLQAHCLGIGTSPSTTQGEIRATGDIIANYSSDRRLKKYIKNIPNALEKVSQINGVSFEWKKADAKIKREVHSHEGHDVGVIAQEVEEVLPEVVSTRDNGYKAVNYEKIVPLLIEAIKDLKAEIDELKKSK